MLPDEDLPGKNQVEAGPVSGTEPLVPKGGGEDVPPGEDLLGQDQEEQP